MRFIALIASSLLLISCVSRQQSAIHENTPEVTTEVAPEVAPEVTTVEFSELLDEFAKNIRDNGEKLGIVATRHGVRYHDEQEKTCKAEVFIQIAIEEKSYSDQTMKNIDFLVKDEFSKLVKNRSFSNKDKQIVEASIEYNVVAIVSKERNRNEQNVNPRISANAAKECFGLL